MAKQKSRPKRWAAAVSEAQAALRLLKSALEELESVRSEYGEWRDGLPDNLQSGALADKLNTIADMEFDSATDDLENLLSEAEVADLPLGFGRD